MIDESTIRERIEALKAERDKFIAQANQQVAAYNGAVQALEQLIGVEQPATMPALAPSG